MSQRSADDPVGLTEVAELLGVTRQRASQLRHIPGFPKPIKMLAMGPIWEAAEIRKWKTEWEQEGSE